MFKFVKNENCIALEFKRVKNLYHSNFYAFKFQKFEAFKLKSFQILMHKK